MKPEAMISELKDRGMKITPQRLEIVRTLFDNREEHPSLNHLFASVRHKMPTISFSTLYNTISTLERSGMIRLFDLKGETRIETNLGGHLNLVDESTGEILDFGDEQTVEKVISELDEDRTRDRKVLINVILYDQNTSP